MQAPAYLSDDLLNAPYLPAFQCHFDSTGMKWSACQNPLYLTNCTFSRTLILFQNNSNFLPNFYIGTKHIGCMCILQVHCILAKNKYI